MFMFAFITCVAANVYSQGQVVSLDLRGADVGMLFREIRKQTGLRFVYNEQHASELPRFDVKRVDAPVEEVLDEVFGGSPLQWYLEDNIIVVTRRPQAQAGVDNRVAGRVKDETGTPLQGVTIRVAGASRGYITDAQGFFQFNIPVRDTLTIFFSFVGMETQGVLLRSLRAGETRPPLEITMKEGEKVLQDLVVTGFANIRRSSFTGTATRVTREELMKVSTGNVLQALQVFDPSLRTVRNNEMGSDPNTLPEFNIRGAAGVGITELDRLESSDVSQFALKNNPNLPVFILDGYEVSTEKIYDMDPNRIESITILKDAAATAMYGSRAANGVIVIETVAPRPGELRVTYNLTGTLTAPDLSSYDLMNAQEKLDAEVAAGLLDERSSFYQYFSEWRGKMNNINIGVDTYWLSQPLRTQVNHRHSLYLESGSESVRMGVGMNYDAEAGVMKGSYRDRMGAELRADYRFKGIQVTDQVTFSRTRSQASPYGDFSTYARLAPYYPIHDPETGEVTSTLRAGNTTFTNPLYSVTHYNDFSRSGYLQFANNLSLNAFFLEYFQLKFQLAATYTENSSELFYDPGNTVKFSTGLYTYATRGELYLSGSKSFGWSSKLMLMYNRDILDHNINVNIALDANENRSESESHVYNGFPSAQFHEPKYANGTLRDPSFNNEHSRLLGALLQGNYTFKNAYLLDVSARMDGSSRFGSKRRFAPFWSFGAGLNLHKYEFMQNYPVINIARVKANYGQTGRVSFSPYAARDTYQLMMDDWYTTGMGGALIAMGNEDLSWDNVNTLNLALDLTLWNRLTLNLAWYDKRTKDMVTSISIPSSSGFTSYTDNMGETSNKGFEVLLSYALFKDKDWNVNLTANGAHNKNEIIKISNALKAYNDRVDAYYDGYRSEYLYLNYNEKYLNPIRKYEEGGSEYAIFGMKSLGISPEDGTELFLYRDGSVSSDWDPAQQMIIGNTEPFMQGAFGVNARYKGFTLYTSFMYEFGGDLYNSTLVREVESANIQQDNADRRVFIERWKQPGDLSPFKSIKALSQFTRPTSRFVQRNNTLTFNSLSLGYDMDRALTRRLGLSMVRFQFTMNEIAVFSTIRQERGISYPFARKFGFTLNASF
ncbi:MAG: SusC/RagA family TonB-linked outer membrane protein [Odoribacteraceae bacterium]|nr:SusC/RagA family TonB-linked outer membrane protein [Odoribacteraceae bacterium]